MVYVNNGSGIKKPNVVKKRSLKVIGQTKWLTCFMLLPQTVFFFRGRLIL